MKRILLLLLLLIPSVASAQLKNKIVVFYGSFQGAPVNEDRFECMRRTFERGGWTDAPTKIDYINVDSRNWQTGTDDPTFFSARYDAAFCIIDGFASLVIASGFGTNFQNAAGTARVAYGPLGGRWSIPSYVLTHRVVPSTTGVDDSTSNLYMAGITSASPAGTFTKPSATSWEAWRYRQIFRNKTENDTLYCDPVVFGCRPATWTGVGSNASVASIALVDSGTASGVFGAGGCAAGDTCVSVWKYRPRLDKPGVTYCVFNQAYNAGQCQGILLLLQRMSVETGLLPPRKIKITLVEHDSRPAGTPPYSAAKLANYKAFMDKMYNQSITRYAFNPTSPTAFEISLYADKSIVNKFNESIRAGIIKWVPMSYESGWTAVFYTSGDTANYRQVYNELIRCAISDTFGYDKNGLIRNMVVTSTGIVGVWLGKVYKDAGTEIIETTFSNENPSGWSFMAPPKPFTLSLNTLPGDRRTIYSRLTLSLGHALTFTPGTHASTVGDHEYIGSSWIVPLYRATTGVISLYWHTGGVGGACADDPYWQWLMGDVFVRQVRAFDRIIEFDNFTNPRF